MPQALGAQGLLAARSTQEKGRMLSGFREKKTLCPLSRATAAQESEPCEEMENFGAQTLGVIKPLQAEVTK